MTNGQLADEQTFLRSYNGRTKHCKVGKGTPGDDGEGDTAEKANTAGWD